MLYNKIKNTLLCYYKNVLDKNIDCVKDKVFIEMDNFEKNNPGLNVYQLKSQLYRTLSKFAEPVLFDDVPFFFESGLLSSLSDGKFMSKGKLMPNSWLYVRNRHIFKDETADIYEIYCENTKDLLYSSTSTYTDVQHAGIPAERLFSKGLSGIRAELSEAENSCKNSEQSDFVKCAIDGIDAMLDIADKFRNKALENGFCDIAELCESIPSKPPKTYHEGLCMLAFMRKTLGGLEAMGFNSFGRVDVILKPLYDNDRMNGISRDELYDLTCRFLLIWDSALDRNQKIAEQKNYNFELENTLTLGGCDKDGNVVYNEVTEMFLQAQEELALIYPKYMIRYGSDSPREYLNMACKTLLKGQNTSLFENDDSIIPALVKSGIELRDARNYIVSGCWDAIMPECGYKFSGEYVNLVRPVEWAVHRNIEAMERNKMYFEPYDDALSFEEIYDSYIDSVRQIMTHKAEYCARGSRLWKKINPVCILSALTQNCVDKLKDITAGGSKYNWESEYYVGFSDAVDSLLAIKHLCFDKKLCTLKEFLDACRHNWEGNEDMRQLALKSPKYGDSSEETSLFAGKVCRDLYMLTENLPTAYGGKHRMGFNQYIEIIYWGQQIASTPNGRYSGEPYSQGLTPSRFCKGASVTDVLTSMRYLGFENYAGNCTASIILPSGKMTNELFYSFFMATAKSGIQAMQLNCVSREMLERALEDPEHNKHIIVRICGFSAQFVSLSDTFKKEFMSRNFHDI